MIKKMNPFSYALTFTGCFLGAGYVSGQELWQFFASFGVKGILGLVISLSLLYIFGVILQFYTEGSGIKEMDIVIAGEKNVFFRRTVAILEIILLIGLIIIMAAGAGSLIYDTVKIPKYIGSLIFCILSGIVAAKGLKGLVSVFEIIVPILVLSTGIICIISLIKFSPIEFSPPAENAENPLLQNFFISSLTYVSYNFFSAIGVLMPFSVLLGSKRNTRIGTFLGCLFLFLIAFGIIISIFAVPSSKNADLPMLYIASSINKYLGYFYSMLLFFGMFGASISCLFAVVNYFEAKSLKKGCKKNVLIVLVLLFSWVGSFLGFGNLIGIIYPLFGYFGIVVLLAVLFNYLKFKNKIPNIRIIAKNKNSQN